MFDREAFRKDPRGYALDMVESGLVDPVTMITACLKYLSHDDCREMLDANELSPRFDPDDVDDPDGVECEMVRTEDGGMVGCCTCSRDVADHPEGT